MNRKKIEMGIGILAFIVGFIFLSVVSWLINTKDIDPDTITVNFFRGLGVWSLIGLALISIGVIVILLARFEK